jgi:hypothetical protein
MNITLTIVMGVLTVVNGLLVLYVRSFTSSFAPKKGETAAIQEDLKKLVEQGRTLTQATKEIEAKISDDVWSRQKRWEVTRDLIFEPVRETGPLLSSVHTLLVFYAVPHHEIQTAEAQREQGFEEYQEMMNLFRRATSLFTLICSSELARQFIKIELSCQQAVRLAIENKNAEATESYKEGSKQINRLRDLVRKELRIE